ncbi:DNA repair protein RecN [bacterium HR40]|nr:DNA repair protein RecN [bacterium HR40]
MLSTLVVRDFVLIDRLELAFGPGLTVLTGETGAGKSIVLDALGLALGGRAERSMVRRGAAQTQVTAGFTLPAGHPVFELLAAQGIDAAGEEILIRRQVSGDGRSRAWIEDVAVGNSLLRRIGSLLVEIHGQHASRALDEPGFHRDILDRFGGHEGLRRQVRTAFEDHRAARHRLAALEAQLEQTRQEREELERLVQDLEDLAPRPGEEEELAERRRQAMNREKLASLLGEVGTLLSQAVERLGGAERRARRALEFDSTLASAVAAIERAAIEVGEAEAQFGAALERVRQDTGLLEKAEARLFALRDAARRYRCRVEELPQRLEAAKARLGALAAADPALAEARRIMERCERALQDAVSALSRARREAAERLAAAVASELPPLRLDRARFRVALDPLPPERWGPEGGERVRFEAQTNPGQPFDALDRIASGGELARFMLALELVIARLYPATTMIFDEVDSGIGGATAAAVGERLARLARERQVLVVTHAPQIAARADRHLRVEKQESPEGVSVRVEVLGDSGRREELARMLAGLEVTEAARAAASSLLDAKGGSGA